MIWLIIIFFMIVGGIVSSRLKSKFKKYSLVPLTNGMTGKDVAEKMLADHGIRDVKVVSTAGRLTDHYNPKDKTVNLSEAVYNERNAAAAAVAAHECGHAVPHEQAYSWLQLRSTLVPAVNISSKLSMWLIFGGLILGVGAGVGLGYWVVVLGFVLMAVATVFSFVTLPVEYDASNRALVWLKNKHMVSQEEFKGAEDALKWAARTYLVAALSVYLLISKAG